MAHHLANQLNKIPVSTDSRTMELSISSVCLLFDLISEELPFRNSTFAILNPTSVLIAAGAAILHPSMLFLLSDTPPSGPITALSHLKLPYDILLGPTGMLRPHSFDIALVCPPLAKGDGPAIGYFNKALAVATRAYALSKQDDRQFVKTKFPEAEVIGTLDVSPAGSSNYSKDLKAIPYDVIRLGTRSGSRR